MNFDRAIVSYFLISQMHLKGPVLLEVTDAQDIAQMHEAREVRCSVVASLMLPRVIVHAHTPTARAPAHAFD